MQMSILALEKASVEYQSNCSIRLSDLIQKVENLGYGAMYKVMKMKKKPSIIVRKRLKNKRGNLFSRMILSLPLLMDNGRPLFSLPPLFMCRIFL